MENTTPLFSPAPLWVGTWDICQSSELYIPLLLSCSLREKSQLFSLLPEEYSSPIIANPPLQGRKTRQDWQRQVGSWWGWARPKLQVWMTAHSDALTLLLQLNQPIPTRCLFTHFLSFSWEPCSFPDILKLQKDGDSFKSFPTGLIFKTIWGQKVN